MVELTDGCYSEGDSQGLFTPVSLRYPVSVVNKNSTLKEKQAQADIQSKNWSYVCRSAREGRAREQGTEKGEGGKMYQNTPLNPLS